MTTIEILIVDDDATNRELAARQLDRLGYKTTLVCNGWEALAAIQQKVYNLILMDYQMPGLDGCEATRYIRAFEVQSNRQQTPIIAFTANIALDKQICLEAGMNDYVNKPANRETLRQIIERWLNPISNSDQLLLAFSSPESATNYTCQKQFECLHELLDENTLGADILAHIIQIYLEDSPAQIAALRQALTNQNLCVLRRTAHTLKSASFSLKANQLGEFCAELEKHAQIDGFESEKIRLLNQIETSHQVFLETLQLFSQQHLLTVS